MPEHSNPNAAAVRRSIEQIDRDGLEGALRAVDELCHPEAEWRPLLTGVDGRVYHGQEGLREFWRELFDAFEQVRWHDLEVRSDDDRVVLMLATCELRGRGSGASVEVEMGVVYEFDGDLARWGAAYPSHAEAERAAAGRAAEVGDA